MEVLNGNPRLESPPNFQAPGYAIIRQALVDRNQREGTELNDEGAAKQLLDAWEDDRRTRQAAWDEATAEEERTRAEIEAERLREEEESRNAEEKKKKTKFPTLVPGLPPPKDSGFRPCQRAITRLENLEFIKLWYFTFAGCQIAKNTTLSEEDGMLSVTQEDGRIQFKRSSSTTSYRHLVVPDSDLDWKDLLQAKNVFLESIAKHGWPEPYLRMFNDFYCKLELRSELRQANGHGEQILISYHARARKEWFDSARLKTPFDISVIDEEWMTEARQATWDSIFTQQIKKTQEEVKSKIHTQERRIKLTTHFSPLFFFHTSHAFYAPLPHASLLHASCLTASCLTAS